MFQPVIRKRRAGRRIVSRRQKDPLRPLTADERTELERVSRAGSERADRVAHAKVLLAVADGARLAGAAGRRSGRAVAHLVGRFNRVGLAALDRKHGGGPEIQYGAAERERILEEFRRAPDRERDGTATWSLTTLQRVLREAPDGLPLYTPLGGSWLNMAESIQRIVVRRALAGQHPQSTQDLKDWLAATVRGWNAAPTPFEWAGKRAARRQRARARRHAPGGSGGCTRRPICRCRRAACRQSIGHQRDN